MSAAPIRRARPLPFADGKLTFLARGQHPTTLENISDGARGAEAEIHAKGVEFAPDMVRFSSCSAAGGLRMVAMGYMPRVTAKAAKEVAMTAGARVMEVVSADEPPEFREEVLREIKPDIILLSGGTDGGDMANVLENADIICKVHGEGTVILGCNKFAQREAAEKFRAAGIDCIRVPNILPTIHELNVKPARIAIHEQFINQITHAKGLQEFRDSLADQTVIPTPGAVLLASELLAKGSYEQEGVGGVILVDIGGATTDIHSALPELIDMNIEERGLVVSNEKQFSYRTVEGNLGLRVSATGIPEAVGDKAVLRAMDHDYGLTPEDVENYVDLLEAHNDHIPADEKEACLDRALAACAADVAIRRHAGYYAKEADPSWASWPALRWGAIFATCARCYAWAVFSSTATARSARTSCAARSITPASPCCRSTTRTSGSTRTISSTPWAFWRSTSPKKFFRT